LCRYVIGKDI